jgi:hypothetical protein
VNNNFAPFFAGENRVMDIEELLTDIEAGLAQLDRVTPALDSLKPIGFDRVTFNRDHFVGFITNTSTLRLTAYRAGIRVEPGTSLVGSQKLARVLENLIGSWLRIQVAGAINQGRLLSIENGLAVLGDNLLPIRAIEFVELRAVDNPTD